MQLKQLTIPAIVAASLAASDLAQALPAGPTPPKSEYLVTTDRARVAVPADDVMHGGLIEWWYLHVIDPKTKKQIVGALFNSPLGMPISFGFMAFQDGNNPSPIPFGSPDAPLPVGLLGIGGPAPNDKQPGVRTPYAQINYDEARNAYHFTSPNQADVWFDGNPRPGITGELSSDSKYPPKTPGVQWMGWTSPVATSTVSGWINLNGKKIDVSGWRGYHDHNWGDFTMFDQVFDGWEWGAVHEPDGGASLFGGLVRKGGEYYAAMADVDPVEPTKVCSSSQVRQGDWIQSSDYFRGGTFGVPGTLKLRCGPTEKYDLQSTWSVVQPWTIDSGALGMTLEAQYKTVEGSLGMYEHVRTFLGTITALSGGTIPFDQPWVQDLVKAQTRAATGKAAAPSSSLIKSTTKKFKRKIKQAAKRNRSLTKRSPVKSARKLSR